MSQLNESIIKLKKTRESFEKLGYKPRKVLTEDDQWLETLYASDFVGQLNRRIRYVKKENVVFVCIGSDRVTGDSIGPLIGSSLKELGYDVIGTLDEPVHALNMVDRLKEVPKFKKVIAIDASTSNDLYELGSVCVVNEGLAPGKGLGKDLGVIGEVSIKCVVSSLGYSHKHTYDLLCQVRLGLLMKMRDYVVDGIEFHFKGSSSRR